MCMRVLVLSAGSSAGASASADTSASASAGASASASASAGVSASASARRGSALFFCEEVARKAEEDLAMKIVKLESKC